MMTRLDEEIKLILSITICLLFIATAFSGAAINISDDSKNTQGKSIIKSDENSDSVSDIDSLIISNTRTRTIRSSLDLNPIGDAQVIEGYPSNNYGSATFLYVQSASSGASSYQDERAWTKFDINGIIPGGSIINSAILRLFCWKAQGQNMDASVHGSTDDSWDEMSITWNNQPSFGLDLDSVQLVVGQTYVWIEWNVTSFVQNEWTGDKVVSFVVKPIIENSSVAKTYSFNSKEYTSNYPVLRLEYSTAAGQPIVSDIPDQFIEWGSSFSTIPLDDFVDDPDHLDEEIIWTYSGNSELNVIIDPITRIAIVTSPTSGWLGQETITFRATDPDLLWDEDSAVFTITSWIDTATSPYVHSYGAGVAGAGEYVFLATGETTGSSKLMRYTTGTDEWITYTDIPYLFKNSVAMNWDHNNYIYTLFGGSYSDCRNQVRHYFSRFNINTEVWENLPDTPWYQGPGDAITWVNLDGFEYIYTLLGSSSCSGAPWGYPGPPYPEGVQFWRYNVSSNVWDQNLTRIPYGSDDGADLSWTGGDYIYAFPGAYNEGLPKDEERHFFRYSISGDNWVELENTPYKADGGVDDGGSLLYPEYGDYIYALKGGDDGAGGGGSPGDDFWRYSITNNNWEILPSIPLGVGDQNGHRLGFSEGNIYCWRGCFGDGTLWSYPIGYILNLIDFPLYIAENNDFFSYEQLSGAAVAQMNLNYMWWNNSDSPGGVPSPGQYDDQEFLFNYSAEGQSFMDANAMLMTLNDLDPSFYNFGIYHNSDSDQIIGDICNWIDYDVPGVDVGFPVHVPGAVPAFGDYSRWMSIRGIHTNHSVYGSSESLTVHGFWVNDPYPTGIGANSYKMASEWLDTYYLPISVPDDPYYDEYVAICEPPEGVTNDVIITEVTEYWEYQFPDPQGGQFLLQHAVDNLVVYAAKQGVRDRLIPYDQDFAAVFEQTYAGRPLLIKNPLEDKHDYYAVPFNNIPTMRWIPRGGHTTPNEDINLVVVLVDAMNGQFKEASWVDEPVKYLPISRTDALEIVFDKLIEMGINPEDLNVREIKTGLVYQDSSPYYPDWRVLISELGLEFFVSQDGGLN